MTALGLLMLGLAPQAQDLFVEFPRAPWRIPLFLLFLLVVWAMPTHYAARLLLDTDARFQQAVAAQQALDRARWIEAMECWAPRLLGLLTFVAVLIAIWRSHANLPILHGQAVIDFIDPANKWLLSSAGLVVLVAAVFLIYTIRRSRDAEVVVLRALKNLNRWLDKVSWVKPRNPQDRRHNWLQLPPAITLISRPDPVA